MSTSAPTVSIVISRAGMLEALNYWSRKWESPSEKLLVAGYSTDSLKSEIDSEGIEFLGELHEEQLDELLAETRACLCYQTQASGALTRIAEMLVAGVPIIANDLAARSYYNIPGVSVVEKTSFYEPELIKMDVLNQAFPVPHQLQSDQMGAMLIEFYAPELNIRF